MKNTLKFLIVALILPYNFYAQSKNSNYTSAFNMGFSSINTIHQDINAIFGNQSGLANIQNSSVSLNARNNYFIPELSEIILGAAIPTKAGTFGLNTYYYGFDLYNEKIVGLAYARKITKSLSIGGQFNYLGYSIPTYGNRNLISFEIGGQYQINNKLNIGTHIKNPITIQITENQTLNTVITFGSSYQPSEKLLLAVEAQKDLKQALIIKGAFDYKLSELLALRGGVSTNPTLANFGFGLNFRDITLDFGASFHQTLGISTGLGVVYQFN